jgi:hypothetical protein
LTESFVAELGALEFVALEFGMVEALSIHVPYLT